MNLPTNNFCQSCGKDLRISAVVTPARAAAGHHPSGSMRDAEPEFGHGRGDRFMARKSFSYVDRFGTSFHVKAGITFVSPKSEAFKLHPDPSYWAA
ncbi:MAG: hypothetical protein ACLQGJ_12330 [Candidatus Dormibacteria bacterium]